MNLLGRMKIFTGVLAVLGLVDALYLTWVKLSHHEAACLPGIGNCEVVNTSKYSAINGMPIAVLGAGAYLLILVVLYLESRNRTVRDNGPLIIFGLTLIGVLYSAYLTYLELAVIHAICPYCVVSAIIMILIFAANLIRLIQNQAKAHH
jgi:uncharacterized membrane protein